MSAKNTLGLFANQFGATIFADFGRIATLARTLNTTLRVPEIVVLGRCGVGKSSFLEALLDLPFAVSRKGAHRVAQGLFSFLPSPV